MYNNLILLHQTNGINIMGWSMRLILWDGLYTTSWSFPKLCMTESLNSYIQVLYIIINIRITDFAVFFPNLGNSQLFFKKPIIII